jgi:hypothetical protein
LAHSVVLQTEIVSAYAVSILLGPVIAVLKQVILHKERFGTWCVLCPLWLDIDLKDQVLFVCHFFCSFV